MPIKHDKPLDVMRYVSYVLFGVKVTKTSPKPFKSRLKVNTVKGMIKHPKLDNWCFTFHEDDSYVECHRCKRV